MMDGNGLVTIPSPHGVTETIDLLVAVAKQAGMVIFARIDHAAGARDVGMDLRPTELLIFGNPRGGTPLMQDRQSTGIDLPLKALAWEDEQGKVWLSCNDPRWIAERHRLGPASSHAVDAVAAGLRKVASAATDPASQEDRP